MSEVAIQDFKQVILSNQVVTASSSQILTGFGSAELVLSINVSGAVTGTSPTLTFTVQEVDPGDQVTLIGSAYTGAAIVATGTQLITIPVMIGSCAKISWAIGGSATPTFNGVYATIISKTAGTASLYDNAGRAVTGVAGTPGPGVLSIQGVSGGTTVPVSGTVTATNASIGVDGSTAPTSSTQVGGPDGSGNLRPATVKNADPATNDYGMVVRPVNQTAADLLVTATQGPANSIANSWPVEMTDGTNILGTSAHPVVVKISYADTTATGTITSNQNVAVSTQGAASTGVKVTGVWTGTLQFQASVDGTNWDLVNAVVPVTGAEVTSTTANGVWEIPSGGYQQVRVLGNTVGSGTATVALDSGTGAQVVEIGAPLPTGTNTIGAVNQGTANTLANAWPMELTDGTNGPVAVKAPSTAAVATDKALVVAISPNNPITLSSSDVTATGALGALNNAVTVTIPGLTSVGFQLAAGTLIGTIIPETSQDGGTTWNASLFIDATTGAVTTSLVFGSSNTAASKSIVLPNGVGQVRVRVSAYTSGTANGTVRASDSYNTSALSQVPSVGSALSPILEVVGLATDNNLAGALAFGESSRLRIGVESLLWSDSFDGTTVNTVRWTQSTLTMTQAQTQSAFNMNNGATTTASTYSILTSTKSFLLTGEYAVSCRFKAKLTAQTNAVIELGFLAAATTSAPTNGVFFRVTSAGVQQLVINYNGTETTSTISPALTAANYYQFVFYMYGNTARLDILNFDNSLFATTTLQAPVTQGTLIQTAHIPMAARVYNTATPPGTAANLILTSATVSQLDLNMNKTWGEQLAGSAKGAVADPLTGVQLQTYANSAAPSTTSTGSLSNTTAAATTLGGLFAFNTPAGAETDYLLFAYQVPTGFTLFISGVQIATYIMGAQSTTNPTLLQWGLAVGSSAASLATAGANPPLRTAIGMQQAPKSANLGDPFTPGIIQYNPRVPLVCYGGKFVQIFVRVPLGNATVGQINRGMVTLDAVLQ